MKEFVINALIQIALLAILNNHLFVLSVTKVFFNLIKFDNRLRTSE